MNGRINKYLTPRGGFKSWYMLKYLWLRRLLRLDEIYYACDENGDKFLLQDYNNTFIRYN